MKFTELEIIMTQNGIYSLADIARSLETTPQAVSNWKARDQVPYHVVNRLNKDLANTSKKIESSFEEQSVSFSDILVTLATQLKVILLIPFITVFLTFTYVMFIQEPRYASAAKILLPDNKSNAGGGLAGLASQFGLNIPSASGGADLSSPRLLPDIMRSRTFAQKLLKKDFYSEKYDKKLPLLNIIIGTDENIDQNNMRLIMGAYNDLNNEYLEFVQDPLSSFSIISIFAPEPLLARDLALEVVSELESLNRYYKGQNVSEKISFIENRIASVEVELKKSEQVLRRFNENNRQISSPSLQLQLDRFTRNVEIQKEVYLTLKQQQELAKIDAVQEKTIFQVLDSPQIPLGPVNKNIRMSSLIAIVFGLGLGLIFAFIRGYANTTDMQERKKIRRGKNFFKKKSKSFLFDYRVTGTISFLLTLGLPFYLTHESANPEYFGLYSTRLFIINIIYVLLLITCIIFFFYSRKKEFYK